MSVVPFVEEAVVPLIESVEEPGYSYVSNIVRNGRVVGQTIGRTPQEARNSAEYYEGGRRGFGIREIVSGARNIERTAGFGGVLGLYSAGKRAYHWFEDHFSNKKQKMSDMQMVVVDGGGPLAIPKKSYGVRGKKKRYGGKMSKFSKRVYGMIEKAQERMVPLKLFNWCGTTDPSQGNVSLQPYYSIVDVGNRNSLSFFMNGGIIYDSTAYGVAPGTPTFPLPVPYQYVRNGGGVQDPNSGLVSPFVVSHSFGNFFGSSVTGFKDEQWIELKYQQDNIDICIPVGLTAVKICFYYLLIPAEYANGSINFAGALINGMSYGDAINVLNQTYGSNWFQRNLPYRLNPQKMDVKLLKKLYISYDNKCQTNQGWVSASPASNFAESLPTNYLVNMQMKRIYKKWRFKYGKNGLRFFVTNRASEWLSWASVGVFYFFLGNDRMTPYVPVRMIKYYTMPTTPGLFQGPNIADSAGITGVPVPNQVENMDVFIQIQPFTWNRIENQGNF